MSMVTELPWHQSPEAPAGLGTSSPKTTDHTTLPVASISSNAASVSPLVPSVPPPVPFQRRTTWLPFDNLMVSCVSWSVPPHLGSWLSQVVLPTNATWRGDSPVEPLPA